MHHNSGKEECLGYWHYKKQTIFGNFAQKRYARYVKKVKIKKDIGKLLKNWVLSSRI